MSKKNFKFRNVLSTKIPKSISPKKSWGSRFDRKSGFALRLPHRNTVAVFTDKRLSSGKYDQIMQVIGKEAIAAKIITFEKEEWTVKTEPLQKSNCGITGYTAKGKVILAGKAHVKRNGDIKCSARTLYPGIKTSPLNVEIHIKIEKKPDGGWSVEAGGSCET